MANSYESGLLVNTISATTQTVLKNRLAPLRLFTSDFSDEVKRPKDTVIVPVVSAAEATQTNPTNFEPGSNTTIGKASVALDHIFQPFGLSNSDLMNGRRLEQIIQINLDAFADKVWSLAITPITTVNFGAATVTSIPSLTPSGAGTKALWAAVSKSNRKGLVLTSTVYSEFLPTSTQSLPLAAGAYGFDNGVYYVSNFTGAVSGLDGFACSPEAIAIASATPAIPAEVSEKYTLSETVQIPDLGMTVYWNVWGSTSNRAINASIEVMFGASAAVTSGTMALAI
jgi:hypothetical protein